MSMTKWDLYLSIWGNEIEFQAEFPDDYNEQQVYDAVYADMWLEMTRGA